MPATGHGIGQDLRASDRDLVSYLWIRLYLVLSSEETRNDRELSCEKQQSSSLAGFLFLSRMPGWTGFDILQT